MSSVGSLIKQAGRRYADRVALVGMRADPARNLAYVESSRVSYGELYEDVLRLCSALRRCGVSPGERLAVLLDNSVEMVVSEWACLIAGYIWVSLNSRSSPAELAAIVADSRPSVLVIGENRRDLLAAVDPDGRCRCLTVGPGGSWRSFLDSGSGEEAPQEPGPEDPVRIRYTSGTAGLPKGAVLPRRCYDASVETVAAVIAPVAADDVLLQAAPMTHASGAMLLPHAAVGARALLLDRVETAPLIDLVESSSATAVFMVPTMLLRFLDALADPRRVASLRSIVYGGAAMPPHRLLEGLELLGPVFIQIYGLTESTWPVTALLRQDHLPEGRIDAGARTLARLASCGRPTAVGRVRVVDGEGRETEPGQAGELLVRGRNTMLGYWDGDTESHISSAASDKGLDAEGWMHTGDIGFRDEEGFITIVDRLHDMIVSGGFNVYPREVEDALCSHPAVLEAAVVGRPHPEWGESVHACVVLRPGAHAEEQELIAHCASRIAGYKKPRSLELVSELPRNSSGKILRRALKQP